MYKVYADMSQYDLIKDILPNSLIHDGPVRIGHIIEEDTQSIIEWEDGQKESFAPLNK